MDLLDIEKINKEMALLACTINGSIYNHRLFDESIVLIEFFSLDRRRELDLKENLSVCPASTTRNIGLARRPTCALRGAALLCSLLAWGIVLAGYHCLLPFRDGSVTFFMRNTGLLLLCYYFGEASC